MNSEVTLLAIALSVIAGLFGILILILGWIGGRLYNKLDEVVVNLQKMASELHDRITGIDKRVTAIETIESLYTANPNRRKNDGNS